MKAYRGLNEDEVEVLRQLSSENVKDFNRGDSLIRQGRTYDGTYILLDGWAMRYRDMGGEKRQIISFVLPGEIIDLRACVSRTPIYTVTLLTKGRLASFRPDRLLSLFPSFPHLAAATFWYTGQEYEMLVRRISALGTGSAAEQIVHLYLELRQRLEIVALADEHGFSCPLTQEHIAQSLGLSVVHVYRTLKRLKQEYQIDVSGHRVTFSSS